jgi:hypothetical protein
MPCPHSGDPAGGSKRKGKTKMYGLTDERAMAMYGLAPEDMREIEAIDQLCEEIDIRALAGDPAALADQRRFNLAAEVVRRWKPAGQAATAYEIELQLLQMRRELGEG